MNKETIQNLVSWLQEYLISSGMANEWAIIINVVVNCIIAVLVVTLLDIVARKLIVKTFRAFSYKTKSNFDDYLIESNFPRFVAHFIPLSILWFLIPFIFSEFEFIQNIGLKVVDIYLVVLSVLIFRSVLRTTKAFMSGLEKYKDKPLESFVQVLMIFAWGIGIFLIISILTEYSIKSIATLGAASAVILMIFKDTIMGFVASIQISVNDIIRIGDWITFSKYGADGNVIEINLATVIVENFDKTFTTIPTYSLISDSFKNWRGMEESGGRRIKRSVLIKQSSIKYLSAEELEDLKAIEVVRSYIEHRQKDIDEHNVKNKIAKNLLVNGRNQTNLGIFRKYVDSLLNNNPAINKDMMVMVRQLAPTSQGIPLEIYCFSSDKNWINYEHIQADILDQILAAIPYFQLEVFELPTGQDFSTLD